MNLELRPYQSEALVGLRRSIASGHRRPILQAPTGSGKTFTACALCKSAIEKGNRVLIIAPRRELVYQFSESLYAVGLSHGIIMAGNGMTLHRSIQVASFDTLHARAVKSNRMPLPEADIVIFDEAHLAIAKCKKALLEHYGDKIIIGLTATPARGDGRGLNEVFDDIVLTWPMQKLVEAGYLVPAKYYAPTEPDLEGLKVARGDYVTKELSERFDRPEIIGDVLVNWQRLASDKQTVVFCIDRKHARHVAEQFIMAGYGAEYLDGETPDEERRGIIERVGNGNTQIVVSILVLTYGVDIPSLECAVIARPTKSIVMYLQCAGRVLRTAPGKTEAVIIDHSGVVDMHGFVDDDYPWSLDAATSITERREKQQKERKEPKEITCSECGAVFKSSRTCPDCGHQMIPPGQPVPTYQADLQEIQRGQKKANREMTWPEKIQFIAELRAIGYARGYKSGFAAAIYREKTGVWPNDSRLSERVFAENRGVSEPSKETLAFVQHCLIKNAKRRDK